MKCYEAVGEEIWALTANETQRDRCVERPKGIYRSLSVWGPLETRAPMVSRSHDIIDLSRLNKDWRCYEHDHVSRVAWMCFVCGRVIHRVLCDADSISDGPSSACASHGRTSVALDGRVGPS